MDEETLRVLCIAGYVVVGLIGLYSALTFAICAAHIRDILPGTVLKHIDPDAPRPRGYSIQPDFRDFIIALTVFLVCWHYSGDAGDMPHHLLCVTAYVMGSWVIFAGLTIVYIIALRVCVWWR